MHPTKLALLGLFCFVLALRAVGAPQEQAGGSDEVLLGAAREKLVVVPDEDGRVRLADLLRRFEEVGGWTLAMSEETRRLAEAAHFFASGPIEAEPAAVPRVVGALVAALGFRWVVVRDEEPRVLGLHSMETTARAFVRERASFVPIEELPLYADHSALLIQTIVSLPHTDVRVLANSLRSIVVDPNLLQIIPLGNSNVLALQGSGRELNDLVAMLRHVDASVSGAEQPAPEAFELPAVSGTGSFTVSAEGESASTLRELLQQYSVATGKLLVLLEESLRLLDAQPTGLSRSLTIAGADFPTFVEEILWERGFVLVELLRGTPGLVTALSLDTTARATARGECRFVDVRSIEACAARPATLFQTIVALPHLDVRTLSNTMRALVVDANVLQVVPFGNSNTLVLQGRGRVLADLVAMLQRLDAEAGANPPAVQEPPSAEEPGEDR